MNFAGLERDIMINADVEVADLDTTELKAKMTCKSVAKGWAKWVKAVKKHPKYLKATKTQRRKFWKKVFMWAIKFDKKNPKYLKASKAQRLAFWKKVAKKVAKWNRSKKCHLVSKKWRKLRAAIRKLRARK